MWADIAYAFGFPPSELKALELDELMIWHQQIERIDKQLRRRGDT